MAGENDAQVRYADQSNSRAREREREREWEARDRGSVLVVIAAFVDLRRS